MKKPSIQTELTRHVRDKLTIPSLAIQLAIRKLKRSLEAIDAMAASIRSDIARLSGDEK